MVLEQIVLDIVLIQPVVIHVGSLPGQKRLAQIVQTPNVGDDSALFVNHMFRVIGLPNPKSSACYNKFLQMYVFCIPIGHGIAVSRVALFVVVEIDCWAGV